MASHMYRYVAAMPIRSPAAGWAQVSPHRKCAGASSLTTTRQASSPRPDLASSRSRLLRKRRILAKLLASPRASGTRLTDSAYRNSEQPQIIKSLLTGCEHLVHCP